MEIDLVLSGSGMLFPCHLGAYAYLIDQGVVVKRIAGTSGGSIVSAGIAHGWTVETALALSNEIAGRVLLDPNWLVWRGVGLHKGDVVHDIFREYLPGKMSDAGIPWGAFVSDVWKRQGIFVSSGHHKTDAPMILGIDINTADVVRASVSIPFWFKMAKVKQRPFVDGGVKLNFGMRIWDDEPNRPTIGVRFKDGVGEERRTNGALDNVAAILSMVLDNANHTYISKNQWPFVIETTSAGNGMDFNINADWVKKRFDEGWAAAEARWPAIKELCDGKS